MPRSAVSALFGGALGSLPQCSAAGDVAVSVQGTPTDLALRAWALEGELQHATDDNCLVKRYLKSYEADVQALPDTFSAGYLGLGSCDARLDERLKRTDRAQNFANDYVRFTNDYDGRGGSHTVSATPAIGAGCNTITISISGGSLPPASRDCRPWSPP